MRECHRNDALGPMQLKSKQVDIEYHGTPLTCEKMVYACSHCDFELHMEWMQETFRQTLEETYRNNTTASQQHELAILHWPARSPTNKYNYQ